MSFYFCICVITSKMKVNPKFARDIFDKRVYPCNIHRLRIHCCKIYRKFVSTYASYILEM